jgi:ribonuclease P/MRP protein subunit POP5
MKIKPILPSLREKKRYVVFEIISESPIQNPKLISRTILDVALSYIGELGVAQAGIMVMDDQFNPQSQKGIIRVNHRYTDALKSTFTLVHNISNTDLIMRSVGISGILKKAHKKFMCT